MAALLSLPLQTTPYLYPSRLPPCAMPSPHRGGKAAEAPKDSWQVVSEDLTKEVPLWRLSCYGHQRDGPNDLTGDVSFEEARWKHLEVGGGRGTDGGQWGGRGRGWEG